MVRLSRLVVPVNGLPVYRSGSGHYFTFDDGITASVKSPYVSATPWHHICTNKNCVSTNNGGPWTPQFEGFFKGAGLDINKSLENLVQVPGHRGPHPVDYHKYVFKQLRDASKGVAKNTPEYKQAVTNVLSRIKKEAVTPGHQVNDWLIGK